MDMDQVISRLEKATATAQRLKKSDFDFQTDAANQRTKIAEHQATGPIALREKGLRLMLTVHEQFTTDGSGGNTETFNLSNDLISTPNTADVVLFEDGTRVRPDSVDHANDTIDYTDAGTGSSLDVFYIARTETQIEIIKSAPRSQSDISETVFDAAIPMLHERDQNQDPPEFRFSDERPLAPVVPKKWNIELYANGPVAQSFEANNVQATNAIISLPITRTPESIDGLADAVKMDII